MQPHPVDIYVGKRLRSRRTMLGKSQEEIGDAVGITFQQVQKYEKGLNRIGSSRLYELSTLLKVNPSYFFEGISQTDDNDKSNDSNFVMAEDKATFDHENYSNKEVMGLLKAYYSVKSPAVRKKLLSLVKAISSLEEEFEKE